MKYTLEVTQCNDVGCRNMISRKDDAIVQEFHVPLLKIDEAILQWKQMFTEEEFAKGTAEVLRHDIN